MALPKEYESALQSYQVGSESDLAGAMAKLNAAINKSVLQGSRITRQPTGKLYQNMLADITGKRANLELAGAERGATQAFQAGESSLARNLQEALTNRQMAQQNEQFGKSFGLQQKQFDLDEMIKRKQMDNMLSTDQQLLQSLISTAGTVGGTYLGTKLGRG